MRPRIISKVFREWGQLKWRILMKIMMVLVLAANDADYDDGSDIDNDDGNDIDNDDGDDSGDNGVDSDHDDDRDDSDGFGFGCK